MEIAKLRRMADQIAKNFVVNGHDEAVAATANHIRKFWEPRMRAQIYADDLSELSPVAREAIEQLMADAKAA
jgi:formate dehydrogenase subunit delta